MLIYSWRREYSERWLGKFHLAGKERYNNHGWCDWKLSSVGMFDFIWIPISVRSRAGERGTGRDAEG